MTSESQTPKSPKWEVKSLRATSFLGPSEIIGQQNWWEKIIGEQPEARISKPKLGGLQESGPFNAGKLNLNIQPMRIDWQFDTKDLTEDSVGHYPNLGLIENVLPEFQNLISKWTALENCPASTRLAFGAVLTIPVSIRKEGYDLLAKFLPKITVDPENSRDFFYQINRPKASTAVQGLEINRLNKWSVMRFTWQMIATTSGQISAVDVIANPSESYSLQLELDINTSADKPVSFDRAQINSLFKELISLGQEISINGDLA